MFGKVISTSIIAFFIIGNISPFLQNVQNCDCGYSPCWPEISGLMGENNWYLTAVLVTFNGSFDFINYRIDGADWINSSTPFYLSIEGIHLLEWTCDTNLSDVYSLEIKIDTTSPIVSHYTQKRIGFLKWQICLNVTDKISGVNRVWFDYADVIDSEPPYQANYTGCLSIANIWNSIIKWLFGEISYPFDAWDNAGRSIIKPLNG